MNATLTFMDGSYWIVGADGSVSRIPDMDMVDQLRGSIEALLDDNKQLNRRLLKLELAVSTLMPSTETDNQTAL